MKNESKDDPGTFEDTVQTSMSNSSLERLLESATRITLASFGGGAVGLALERRQQQTQGTKRPRISPTRGNQLAKTWAASCMFFALILESSRLASPTSTLLELTKCNVEEETDFKEQMQLKALTTIGDYSIGGTVAGLAGAMARRTPPNSSKSSDFKLKLPETMLKLGRRPLIVWGLGTGLSLGLLAGVLQAGIDVGNLYLEKEQQEEELRRQKEEVEEIPPESTASGESESANKR